MRTTADEAEEAIETAYALVTELGLPSRPCARGDLQRLVELGQHAADHGNWGLLKAVAAGLRALALEGEGGG